MKGNQVNILEPLYGFLKNNIIYTHQVIEKR